MAEVIDLSFRRHASELRESWQGRALAAALEVKDGAIRPKHRLGMTLLSVIAHNFDDALPVLLAALFGMDGIGTPFLYSAGKVAKTGHVVADLQRRNGARIAGQAVFRSLEDMQNNYREFADQLFLSDDERIELFDCVKRWVVCDYRLDPNFDRADPDARRLTH